jgi:hypothetical protein
MDVAEQLVDKGTADLLLEHDEVPAFAIEGN